MAHIFKYASLGKRGIIVLTHQEIEYILQKQETHELIKKLISHYYIGVHYGGYSMGVAFPNFCHFFMASRTITDIAYRYPQIYEIPLASGNFTSPVFYNDKKINKYWDIINVSRNSNVKNLDRFIRQVKEIYNAGYNFKVLLISPQRHEETQEDHYLKLMDDYYSIFSRREQDNFTILRLSPELEFKGLSKTALSYFYQASKIFTIFSEQEGFPGVISEALLCGLPIVTWKNMRSSAHDYLDRNNSLLFDNFELSHETLINAVVGYGNFSLNEERIASDLCEISTIPKLIEYFKILYERNGDSFDGELDNYDDLVSRLPAHKTDTPWGMNRHFNAHIKTMPQLGIFTSEALRKI